MTADGTVGRYMIFAECALLFPDVHPNLGLPLKSPVYPVPPLIFPRRVLDNVCRDATLRRYSRLYITLGMLGIGIEIDE